MVDETDDTVNHLWTEVWSLMRDKDLLARKFEQQANSLAWKVQHHKCQATCVKYSIKDKSSSNHGRPLCRFHCPWPLHDSTSVNDLGDIKLKRSHGYINRWNKALAVGLRHNHDVKSLDNSKQSLSMIFYATNYATKLQTPMWRRLSLATDVQRDVEAAGSNHRRADDPTMNHTRQFFMRWANKLFSDREISAVEACYYILGHETDFTPIHSWANVYVSSLYRYLEKRMRSHRLQNEEIVEDEMISLTSAGPTVNQYQAYLERGKHLKELCFWEYVSLVQLRRCTDGKISRQRMKIPFDSESTLNEKWVQVLCEKDNTALPVIFGYFNPDVKELDKDDNFQRQVEKGGINENI
jgi:hypothetical protein